jgi:3-hydroxyacyl-[acyl-carrier-protein] dehydratase
MHRIDREAIARLLPHRDPIALLQWVQIEDPGRAGRAAVRLDDSGELLAGHARSALAQELALEAAAQAVGVVLGSAAVPDGAAAADGRHLLLGFNEVHFEPGFAPPFAQGLHVRVEKLEASASACVARFWVEHRGADVAHGQVMVMAGAA